MTIATMGRRTKNSDMARYGFFGAGELPDAIILNQVRLLSDPRARQVADLVASRLHLLRLRLVLANSSGNSTVPLTYRIPKQAAGQKGKLFLDQAIPYPFEQESLPTTLSGLRKVLRTMVRNDQVQGQLSFFTNTGEILRTKKTAPASRVITGSRRIKVVVD